MGRKKKLLSAMELQWELKFGIKSKIIKQISDTLSDPTASPRDKRIAVKNAITLNKQNIDIFGITQQKDAPVGKLEIKIVDE